MPKRIESELTYEELEGKLSALQEGLKTEAERLRDGAKVQRDAALKSGARKAIIEQRVLEASAEARENAARCLQALLDSSREDGSTDG